MTNAERPRIAVVGAGAVGSYYGALLAKGGCVVTLIGRPAHVEAIVRDGLLLESAGREERIGVAAATGIEAVRGAGLVLVCVKSADTETAAQQMAPHLAPGAVVLSFQNGVDNVERIRRHVANPVLPVLVYAGANIPAPGHVQHTAGGAIVVGAPGAADRDVAAGIAATLREAGLQVRVSDDIEAELWTKLVMNCAYNVISALSGARYGEMIALPEVRDVMLLVVEEVVRIARARGVALPSDISDQTMRLADAMPTTRSSTAQDFEKGRPTEIDHLNGYVAREARRLGVAAPVNRTLTALMKMAERVRAGKAGA